MPATGAALEDLLARDEEVGVDEVYLTPTVAEVAQLDLLAEAVLSPELIERGRFLRRAGEIRVMLHLALPARVRESLESRVRGVGPVHWYGDFAGACSGAREADLMWLSPAMYERARLVELLSAASRLKWLHVSLTGVEEFPFDLLADRGIRLTNGVGLRAEAVAEYTLMVLLAVARGLPGLVLAQAQQRWAPDRARRDGLTGKHLLVIGYGHVGRAIGRLARAVGMRVSAARRTPSADAGVASGAAWRAVLPTADYVVLAVPSTPETRGMIGAAELQAMKSAAVLINVARGDIVDHEPLLEALASGRIRGAVLDCFRTEPLPADDPLWRVPTALVTPHIAWHAEQADKRETDLFLDNLRRYVNAEPLVNLVNLRLGY